MKKFLTSLAAAAAVTLGAAPWATADNVVLHTPGGFQVLAISPNGQWAAGVYIDQSNNTFGFRWNLESDEIRVFGSVPSFGMGVSDDGVVAGDFEDTKYLGVGTGIHLPGYWNGSWNSLEMPKGTISDGICYGINTDGTAIAATVCLNGRYTPYLWRDGLIVRQLPTEPGKSGVPFCVSPDGNAAGGFADRYNRTACYWPPEGGIVYFDDSSHNSMTPWSYARNFSPDGTKLVYWGGWEPTWEEGSDDPFGETEPVAIANALWCLYDITTGERSTVPCLDVDDDLEFYDVSNNGTLVGFNKGRGCAYYNGEILYAEDFLAQYGVDIYDFDDFWGLTVPGEPTSINNIPGISGDESVIALNYYNAAGLPASMIVKTDVDLYAAAPAAVTAEQMPGINTVSLKWHRPAGLASERGYNVYRNGQKISGALPIKRLYFYDKNLEPGVYTYEVGLIGSTGVETRCEAVEVTVGDNATHRPLQLYTRQKGVNHCHLSWQEPLSSNIHKSYFDHDAQNLSGIYVYDAVEMEMAVKFDKNEMACYAGHKIAEVSFIPMSEQVEWNVMIYTADADGALTLVASQLVTQELTYGKLNTVKLNNPVELPTGNDLIVAINVITDARGQMAIAAVDDVCIPGYTDLLRLVEDDTYMSAYQHTIDQALGMSCLTWTIDMGLQPDGAVEQPVASYNIYLDGELAGETDQLSHTLRDLEEGSHTVAVEAVYPDQSRSQLAEGIVDIKAAYPGIENLNVNVGEAGSTEVVATWDAPVDNDSKLLSYSGREAVSGFMGSPSNNYRFTAGAIYPASMLRGHEGYRVKSLWFYPLTDATFTFFIYENGTSGELIDVYEYTLNEWNEVELPYELYIKPGAEYLVAVDVYNPTYDEPAIAIDNNPGRPMYSDLFSNDVGTSWLSFNEETATTGNWLLGMEIEDVEALPVEPDSYEAVIDGFPTAMLYTTEYRHDFGRTDDEQHSLSVNAYYNGESVPSDEVWFFLAPSGIDGVADAQPIKLTRHDGELVAEGQGVEAITVYSSTGRIVASVKGDRVDVSHLGVGVYAVEITVNGRSAIRKIALGR